MRDQFPAPGSLSRRTAKNAERSRLAISHIAAELEREKLNESRDRVNRISHQQYTHRSRAEILRFFDGLEMVEPGLVELRHWRPTIESSRVTPGWCGLGHKP